MALVNAQKMNEEDWHSLKQKDKISFYAFTISVNTELSVLLRWMDAGQVKLENV